MDKNDGGKIQTPMLAIRRTIRHIYQTITSRKENHLARNFSEKLEWI